MQNWKRIAPGSQKTARSPRRSRVVAILLFDGALATFLSLTGGGAFLEPVPCAANALFRVSRRRRPALRAATATPAVLAASQSFQSLKCLFLSRFTPGNPPRRRPRVCGQICAYTRKCGDSVESGEQAERSLVRIVGARRPEPRRFSAAARTIRSRPFSVDGAFSCLSILRPPRATEVWRRQGSRFKPNGQPAGSLQLAAGAPRVVFGRHHP
jgi:hypothetical protein